jgi:hypothetical protein
MKKMFFLLLATMILFITCSDDIQHEMNSFWQLQEVIYPDGTVSMMDSIFYAFQREILFSFTVMNDEEISSISYGFIQYPASDYIIITMDTSGLSIGTMKNVKNDFLIRSGWNDYSDTFNIQLN